MITNDNDRIIMSPSQLRELFPEFRDYNDEMETAEHVEARIIARGKTFVDLQTGERKISALIVPYFIFENGKSRSPEISRMNIMEQSIIFYRRFGMHEFNKNVNLERHFLLAHITLVENLHSFISI